MTLDESVALKQRIKNECEGRLSAVNNLRSLKGPIGQKPWIVRATCVESGAHISFNNAAEWDSFIARGELKPVW